jgi:hypothetical protein
MHPTTPRQLVNAMTVSSAQIVCLKLEYFRAKWIPVRAKKRRQKAPVRAIIAAIIAG